MTDYARGMKDCEDGAPAMHGASSEYLEGYAEMYAKIEQESARCAA